MWTSFFPRKICHSTIPSLSFVACDAGVRTVARGARSFELVFPFASSAAGAAQPMTIASTPAMANVPIRIESSNFCGFGGYGEPRRRRFNEQRWCQRLFGRRSL
jgi:hypothetical protein